MFGDYLCPPCRRADAQVGAILAREPARFRFVFRHYPLEPLHAGARLASSAAEAARYQGRFWEMHDLLMKTRGNVTVDSVTELARHLQLDLRAFRHDVQGRGAASVAEDERDAAVLGVRGTPTCFLALADGRTFRLGSLADLDRNAW